MPILLTMEVSGLSHVQNRIRDIIQRFENLESNHRIKQTGTKNEVLRDNLELSKQDSTFSGQLDSLIEQRANLHGVSPDLVKAVINAESSGKPEAESSKGAIGLMQLMPSTAHELSVNPRNPVENLDGGIRYLKKLAGEFGDLDKTLAAYNAGPGTVRKYGGVPPYQETQQYVSKIKSYLENTQKNSRKSAMDKKI